MFTNNLRAALLTAFVYLICFQLFLSTGYYSFLYAGNVAFCIAVGAFTLLTQSADTKLFLPALTRKGIGFSFVASMFSFIGCLILSVLNFYLFPDLKNIYVEMMKGESVYAGIKNIKWFIGLALINSFFVNIVAGGLAAFFTAGLANEKNYLQNSTTLPSVKH